jgi:hypothetical protein
MDTKATESEALYISTKQAARLYGLSEEYLRKLRHMRVGPPYRKIGKKAVYDRKELAAWFERVSVPCETDRDI